MKTATAFFIIGLFLFSCNFSAEETKDDLNAKSTNKLAIDFIKTPGECAGFWVLEEYSKAIKQTKSTLKASQMEVDDFFRIASDNSVMRLNLHEGGDSNILLMTSNSKGRVVNSDTTETIFTVEFTNNRLIIDNKKYLKAAKDESGLNEFVNSILFSGEYELDNKPVSLKDNGQIAGIDSIVSYNVNLDYTGPGMQCDLIYLTFAREEKPRAYIVEFIGDTLILFNSNCLEMDEVNDFCVEIAKGKEFIRLKRK